MRQFSVVESRTKHAHCFFFILAVYAWQPPLFCFTKHWDVLGWDMEWQVEQVLTKAVEESAWGQHARPLACTAKVAAGKRWRLPRQILESSSSAKTSRTCLDQICSCAGHILAISCNEGISVTFQGCWGKFSSMANGPVGNWPDIFCRQWPSRQNGWSLHLQLQC